MLSLFFPQAFDAFSAGENSFAGERLEFLTGCSLGNNNPLEIGVFSSLRGRVVPGDQLLVFASHEG